MSQNDPFYPSSLYRFQFLEGLTFKDAQSYIPYWKSLGVEGIYCSPVFYANSAHGYDVVDPNKIHPRLGSIEDWNAFCEALKKAGMALLLDIVPNHMSIKGENRWWLDVLEKGPLSTFAPFFDINWSSERPELRNRVLLPILHAPYGEVLQNQEIFLEYKNKAFALKYKNYHLPLAFESYSLLIKKLIDLNAEKKAQDEMQFLLNIFEQSTQLKSEERRALQKKGQEEFHALIEKSKEQQTALEQLLDLYNGKKEDLKSFDLLDELLEKQYYRLAYWKVAAHEINYRRFFNLYELAAICIELPEVREVHDAWIFSQLAQGNVQGVRIDHPDGLYDPVEYFHALREKGCRWTIVEKILDLKEELPEDWEVEGTVGYTFLNYLNSLFVDPHHEKSFNDIYKSFIQKEIDFSQLVFVAKEEFARYQMASEVEALGWILDRLTDKEKNFRDFTRIDLTEALRILIECFPVYRTYMRPEGGVSKRDSEWIKKAFALARQKKTRIDSFLWDFLQDLFLWKAKISSEQAPLFRHFLLRFQQVTGSVMAKGVEDTSFYRYNRLISLNEVGGNPLQFGLSVESFHQWNERKKERWPLGLLTSSTHDSKRNEDVRTRIDVLSELPEEWEEQVKKWALANAPFKTKNFPSANAEYFIYQTLLGIWPRQELKGEEETTFIKRIKDNFLKCIREANEETSWWQPNEEYEKATMDFIDSILRKGSAFLSLFLPFQKKITLLGSWNSLSQWCLKWGSCGTIDIYQGNEMWNDSLVDPDNRRPVDFKDYAATLSQVSASSLPPFDPFDKGMLKLYLHWKALHFRAEHKSLFLYGNYVPIYAEGERKRHVVAFMREFEGKHVLIAAGRFFSTLIQEERYPGGEKIWLNTVLPLDRGEQEWKELFTGEKLRLQANAFPLAKAFKQLPFGVFYDFG